MGATRKIVTSLAVLAVVLTAAGGIAAADTAGWGSGSQCTSNSPGTSSQPDACDTMHDGGGHGVDIHTSQNNTQAQCVYDYAGNPSSCEQTLGAAYNGFGRTAAGTNDGDTLDAYGNSNVFVPTTRIESDAGTGVLTSGSYGACPAGNLVSETGCVFMAASDIKAEHAMTTAPGWTVLALADGWQERGSGFPSLAVSLNVTPPDDAQLEGQVVSGTYRNGVQIATVPASLTPKSEQTLAANCGAGTVCEVTVETSGAVDIWSQMASVTLIQVNGTYVTDR